VTVGDFSQVKVDRQFSLLVLSTNTVFALPIGARVASLL
jgi:hypothetical protein